jgi:predicted DNA-binding protein
LDISKGVIMEYEKDMKPINIKLSLNQHEDLEKLSKRLGNVTKSNLIRIAIAEFIHSHRSLINEG